MTPFFRFVLAVLIGSVLFAMFTHARAATVEWHRFDSIHEAAIYGAQRLESCSHFYECSAVIAQDRKGLFAVGPAHTDYSSDTVGIHTEDSPATWALVGHVHSHPCTPGYDNEAFSTKDIMDAIIRRVPAVFMVDLCTGDVHEFIPGATRIDEVQYGHIWLTPGLVIGHVAAFKDEPLAHEGL